MSPIIVALDYKDRLAALQLVDRLDAARCRLKVGKEMFTRFGPGFVQALQGRGFDVFLDLKFHDIPSTAAAAVEAAADLGVWMVNVHVSGGRQMLEACVHRLADRPEGAGPLLYGVTVLTSLTDDELEEIGWHESAEKAVARMAGLAHETQLDGVVCSAWETASLRARFGSGLGLVTPGIRPAFAVQGDQRRVMTPAKALAAGSDYLVIGRPITQAKEPMEALARIEAEIAG